MSNQGNPMAIVAIIGGMIVALYVSASILLDEGNQLAGLFFYVLIASGALGLIAPRLSFMLFLAQSAYLDLFKRLMVMGGTVSFTDLFWVLGIAPVTIFGIAAGLMLRVIFGKQRADTADMRRLGIAIALNAALGLYVYFRLKGGIGGTLREVANGSTYALLLFIVPLLFPTPESVTKCARFIIYAFVPVAAYGIYQQIFGYQEFEIEYLRSGLSIEIKQLEADRVRAFGTLNSPTSLSVVASSLAAMALSLSFIGDRKYRQSINPPMALILSSIFIGGWAASTVRVGILLVPVALIGMYVFRSPARTKTFYGTLAVLFMILVASSDYMYRNIELITGKLFDLVGDTGYLASMVNLNSYKDRLYGFSNVLANPAAYTLFGMGTEEDAKAMGFSAHDPVSNALLSLGVVPLFFVLAFSTWGLLRFHRTVFVMKHPTLQLLASAFLANAVGNIAVSLVNGNLLGTFPVNVFFWISIAFASTLRHADERVTAAELEPAQAQPSPASQPRARFPRMTPSRTKIVRPLS